MSQKIIDLTGGPLLAVRRRSMYECSYHRCCLSGIDSSSPLRRADCLLLDAKKPFFGKMEVLPKPFPKGTVSFVHSMYHGPTLSANGFGGRYPLGTIWFLFRRTVRQETKSTLWDGPINHTTRIVRLISRKHRSPI